MNFKNFADAVDAQIQSMIARGGELFVSRIDTNILWAEYLDAFPEGTNPVFRERREYDCSICRQFIKVMGPVVTITPEGNLVSIWDFDPSLVKPAFAEVAEVMSDAVKSVGVAGIFRYEKAQVGTPVSHEGDIDWHHFYTRLPAKFVMTPSLQGPFKSESYSTYQLLMRALREVTDEAVNTVLELIDQNSLYRGQEFKSMVEGLSRLKKTLVANHRDWPHSSLVWLWTTTTPPAVSRICGTLIGELLKDLSGDMGLERAVAKYESCAAPANYKRPTALVTARMIQAAQDTVTELGLMDSLQRRFATISDISVNNVMYADHDAQQHMVGGDAFGALLKESSSKAPENLSKIEEVQIDDFLANVLPKATKVEVLFENSHAANLVSLIAPAIPGSKDLFKWGNQFSWSYSGNMADSIKERVKAAGGSATGELCCRLAWDYKDDLDFHMNEPGGHHIYFVNRRSPNGGTLDLDANGMDGLRDDPAENIVYNRTSTMRDGKYSLWVENFARRTDKAGFEVEIEVNGEVYSLAYSKAVTQNGVVAVAAIEVKAGKVVSVTPSREMNSSRAVRNHWGLATQSFHPVSAVLLSPNYWDDNAVGNKHYFFLLKGCQNDGSARGFFNEFLKQELDQHRKVLELIGSRTALAAPQSEEEQLSGLGFSSTIRNHVICRVTGSFTRLVKVCF